MAAYLMCENLDYNIEFPHHRRSDVAIWLAKGIEHRATVIIELTDDAMTYVVNLALVSDAIIVDAKPAVPADEESKPWATLSTLT